MNDDNYQPGSAVEAELLLEYLIEKTQELCTGNYSGFPVPFQALGIAVLAPFPDLKDEFIHIVKADGPVSERSARCREIFCEALDRPQERDSKDSSCNEEPPHDPDLSIRFAWMARRDGKEMLKRHDFRFLQVWEFVCWIALLNDDARFKEFQEMCLEYPDPAERIEAVIPILREVLLADRSRHRATLGLKN